MRWFFILCYISLGGSSTAQQRFESRYNGFKQLRLDSGVTLTFDEPQEFKLATPIKIILFALPNGNTTAQSFGKKLVQGDDWHFDIQHIGAQTEFIRKKDPKTNYIVVYVENSLKSWPAWRRKLNNDGYIAKIVNVIYEKYAAYRPKLMLTGHSGGGSFVFGFLNSQIQIPSYVERVGLLDATYAYESEKHADKLKSWLMNKQNSLQVIAYNDSVVIYNGKPLVSPTGGTWYRSKLIARDLSQPFKLDSADLDDRIRIADRRRRIEIKLLKNPEAKIYHTLLVEKNGFIDIIFNGTKFAGNDYVFWGERAYQSYVLE